MSKKFDPYHKWLGIAPKDQPPNHYRLLAVDLFESDSDVIDAAANRQMAYLQQRATGEHAALSQKLLNEVSAARLCLLDPKRKAAYDTELKSKMDGAVSNTDRTEPTTPDPLAFLASGPSAADENKSAYDAELKSKSDEEVLKTADTEPTTPDPLAFLASGPSAADENKSAYDAELKPKSDEESPKPGDTEPTTPDSLAFLSSPTLTAGDKKSAYDAGLESKMDGAVSNTDRTEPTTPDSLAFLASPTSADDRSRSGKSTVQKQTPPKTAAPPVDAARPRPTDDPLAFLQASTPPTQRATARGSRSQHELVKAVQSTKKAKRPDIHQLRILVVSAIAGLLTILLVFLLFQSGRTKETKIRGDQPQVGFAATRQEASGGGKERPTTNEQVTLASEQATTTTTPNRKPASLNDGPSQVPGSEELIAKASPSPLQQTTNSPAAESETEPVGEVRRFTDHTGEAMSVAFSPDGRLAASGSKQELLLWDVNSGELKWRAYVSSFAVEFSEDGQTVCCCGTRRVAAFDVANGTEKRGFDIEECHDWHLSFSKGARYLVTVKDRRIQVLDVQSQSIVGSCKGATPTFTPNSDLLVLDGHELGKYGIATGSTTSLCRIEQESRIDRMSVSPDNTLLVTGSFKRIGGPIGNLPGDNMVRIWDLQTGRELHALQDHKDWLLSVVFSPDGQRVLSAGGGTPKRYYEAAGQTPVLDTGIRLWDVKAGKLLHRFEGHDQQVNCVRFSPDGKYALSASKDKTVRLWRLTTVVQ